MKDYFITALAPILWGTTYIVTTEFLPEYGPLTVATTRALPIGLVLLVGNRMLPSGRWWWRSFVLGCLNIGGFFTLLFAATYRLPGGVVATVGAIQPLLVAFLVWGLFKIRPSLIILLASFLGMASVGLIVFTPSAGLDPVGILAALGAAVSMACGVALTKHWGRPVPLIVFTGWQLAAGGLLLLPLALLFEGQAMLLPTPSNLFGFAWLGLINTGLGYLIWFYGIDRLEVDKVSFLGLLSPLVALFAGFVVLGQVFSPVQLLGMGGVFLSIYLANQTKLPLSFQIFRLKIPVNGR